MLWSYTIDGVAVQSGDIVCTTNGTEGSFAGALWSTLGIVVPGAVDHVAVYIGPQGRLVEAGPNGVIVYEIADEHWQIDHLQHQRGFVDTFYGVVDPIDDAAINDAARRTVREQVIDYCLAQAAAGKPYNANFFNSKTEDAFYCSQLPYCAYLPHNINLNKGFAIAGVDESSSIVFPQEIWDGWPSRRRARN